MGVAMLQRGHARFNPYFLSGVPTLTDGDCNIPTKVKVIDFAECEFCEKGKSSLVGSDQHIDQLADSILQLTYVGDGFVKIINDDYSYNSVGISYCPVCGKKLTDSTKE